jgi:hypothetical protein
MKNLEEKEFYLCKLHMNKSVSLLSLSIRQFVKGKVYEALDNDGINIMFETENNDIVLLDKYSMKRHFDRVQMMPKFPK